MFPFSFVGIVAGVVVGRNFFGGYESVVDGFGVFDLVVGLTHCVAVDVEPVDIGTVDVGPVDVGPVYVGPVDVGPVDVDSVDIAAIAVYCDQSSDVLLGVLPIPTVVELFLATVVLERDAFVSRSYGKRDIC